PVTSRRKHQRRLGSLKECLRSPIAPPPFRVIPEPLAQARARSVRDRGGDIRRTRRSAGNRKALDRAKSSPHGDRWRTHLIASKLVMRVRFPPPALLPCAVTGAGRRRA